ncbi:MAG: dihydroneopterin aldolase [Gloeomargarita sp. GMQP_bins_120]
MTDALYLHNIRAYGYTGFLPEERTLGQWFAVDLKLELSLEKAAQTDDIADTVDYRGVIEQVQSTIAGARFYLLERLAHVLAEKVLAWPLVRGVTVRVTKVAPPIPNFPGQVSVEVHRTKG